MVKIYNLFNFGYHDMLMCNEVFLKGFYCVYTTPVNGLGVFLTLFLT